MGCDASFTQMRVLHRGGKTWSSLDFPPTLDLIIELKITEIEFQKFDRLLVDNGWIGIMTNFQTEDIQFKNWHYRRDPTHVIFYRQETFKVIGKRWNWEPYFPSKNVVLFQKNGKAA